jgi:hypothetical protein
MIARALYHSQKAKVHGLLQRAEAARVQMLRRYLLFKHRNAPLYSPPSGDQFIEIERALQALGVTMEDWRIEPAALARFRELHRFPENYHGGMHSGVWDEKILEHFVAWRVLKLSRPGTCYIDVAGATSPWAVLLRGQGVEAFSVDLRVPPQYRALKYYVECDAARLPWKDGTVDAMSLQCAYEMFAGESDTRFVREAARVLKPGGRVLVVPLYMHTHSCYYATPDYYDSDLGDAGAVKYLRNDCWCVPASRKYSPGTLLARVVRPAEECGLRAAVYVLRNPEAGGAGIYLRYFLTLTRRAGG